MLRRGKGVLGFEASRYHPASLKRAQRNSQLLLRSAILIRIDLRKLAVSQTCFCDTISSKARPAGSEHMEDLETMRLHWVIQKSPAETSASLHSGFVIQIDLRKIAVSQTLAPRHNFAQGSASQLRVYAKLGDKGGICVTALSEQHSHDCCTVMILS
jgi:hypothetical protein